MALYKIPVSWMMMDDVEVEADSLEDAIMQAEEVETEGLYIDDSFEVNYSLLSEESNGYGLQK